MDNRSSTRIATSVPVGLRFPNGRPREGWGRIINISATGVLVETRFSLAVADVLYISFSLSNGAKFENLRARVIRVGYEEGYFVAGISFDEVVDQSTLRDVISALTYEGGVELTKNDSRNQ